MSYTIMKVLRNFCYRLSLACRRHPHIARNWSVASSFSVLWYLSQPGRWYDILSSGGSYSEGPDRDINSIILMIPASKGKLDVWGWMPSEENNLSLLLWGILLVFTVTALLSALFFNLSTFSSYVLIINIFVVCVYEHHKHKAKNEWASLIHLCKGSALLLSLSR